MKCVKMEEKLLWMAYRNSPTLFRTVPSPTTYGLLFPTLGVCNLANLAYISGTGKATDFKFCSNIYRVGKWPRQNRTVTSLMTSRDPMTS